MIMCGIMRARSFLVRRAAPLLAGLAQVLCALSAAADDTAAPRPILVLAAPQLAGTDLDDRAIAVVAAHLRPLDLDLRVVRPEGSSRDLAQLRADARKLLDAGARGAIWIDVSQPSDLGLYALKQGGDELYGRRLEGAPGKPAAALESLAGIAAAAAEELLLGRTTGLVKIDVPLPGPLATPASEARAVAPPPAPEPGAPPPSDFATLARGLAAPPPSQQPAVPADLGAPLAPSPVLAAGDFDVIAPRSEPMPRLAFSAGYLGGTFGGGVPWQNGASLRVSFAPVQGFYLGAGYDLVAGSRVALPHGSLGLERHPLFAGGGYRFTLRHGFDLQLGARATFDIAQRALGADEHGGPHAGPDGDRLRGLSRTDLFFSAAPVAEVFFLLFDRFRVNAMIGADFVLVDGARLSSPPAGPTGPSGPGGPGPGPAQVDQALGSIGPDRVRLIAGLGVELGVVVPRPAQPPRTASR
jgi:hypothetical protein